MDLGLKGGDGKEYLRLFITDSSSGHKKKRFEKNIYNTHAPTGEDLSIIVKFRSRKR